MDLSLLRTKLIAEHYAQPRDIHRLKLAFIDIEAGLAVLSSMGHLQHLEAGPAPPESEWPKVMFHATQAPQGRMIYNPSEAETLGPNWSPDPERAAELHGTAIQNAGKAGIGNRSLPVATSPALSENQRLEARQESARAARLAALSSKP